MRVDAETFVRVWQSSTSLEQVLDKLKEHEGQYAKGQSVMQRASRLRKRGVPLRYLGGCRPTQPLDVKGLIALARELHTEDCDAVADSVLP